MHLVVSCTVKHSSNSVHESSQLFFEPGGDLNEGEAPMKLESRGLPAACLPQYLPVFSLHQANLCFRKTASLMPTDRAQQLIHLVVLSVVCSSNTFARS